MMKVAIWMYEADNSPYCHTYFLPLCEFAPEHVQNIHLVRISRIRDGFIVDETDYGRVKLQRVRFSLRSIWMLMRFLYSHLLFLKSDGYVLSLRSILPAALFFLLDAFQKKELEIWYDSDGLAGDERVQHSKHSIYNTIVYFASRIIEKQIVIKARKVFVRSGETESVLISRAKLRNSKKRFVELNNGIVIHPIRHERNNGAILRNELRLSQDVFLAVYLGSLGNQYCPDEIVLCVRSLKCIFQKVALLVIANDNADMVNQYFSSIEEEGIQLRVLTGIEPLLVHEYLTGCDLGISFRAIEMPMRHVKPLKNRNYLAAGLPVIYSGTTGDGISLPNLSTFPITNNFALQEVMFRSWIKDISSSRELVRRISRQYAEERFNIKADSFLFFEF